MQLSNRPSLCKELHNDKGLLFLNAHIKGGARWMRAIKVLTYTEGR